jgi:hypothetical protein
VNVTTPDGVSVTVRRQWLPWRLHRRDLGVHGDPDSLGFPEVDSIEAAVVGVVMAVIWLLIGGLILSLTILFSETLLLLLLLLPLLAVARAFWVLPWVIEARTADQVLAREKVRGWRDSEERIGAVAAMYERGERRPLSP